MPNFGDFNFNDDADSVDTDPTPDNIGPEDESSNDGIQNDKTNYHEPGEGDQFVGGDVSEFATNTNPEEPSAQQDEIPPLIIDPDKDDGDEENVRRISALFRSNKPWTDNILDEIGKIEQLIDREVAKELGIKVSELPNAEKLNYRDFSQFARNYHNQSLWTENLLDYFTQDEKERIAAENGVSVEDLDKTTYESLSELSDFIDNSTQWPTVLLNLFRQDSADERAERLLQSTIDIVSDSSLVELLLTNTVVEDELDVIVDTDDADSATNPTGIGDLFDRAIVSEQLGREFLSRFNSIDEILGTPIEYDDLDLSGLEAFEDFIENTDLQVYVGDAVQSSYLNEFQDIGDPALENFDGLL